MNLVRKTWMDQMFKPSHVVLVRILEGSLGLTLVFAVSFGASLGALSRVSHQLAVEKIRSGLIVIEEGSNPVSQRHN